MKIKIKKLASILGVALGCLGIIWFMLPIARHGFGIGSIFGISLIAAGIFLILFYKKIADAGGWKKAVIKFITFFYILGMLWCGYLSILMTSASIAEPPPNTNVIILGAQVHKNGQLSASLKRRVNGAGEYLLKYPETLCIATGGQGGDEPTTEALAEKNSLIDMGIEADRVYLENSSHNTRENFENAMEIAKDEKLGTEFLVVTQEFHMFRALKLAEEAGFEAHSLAVRSDPLLYPGYYGRELLSLTKWHLQLWFT